MFDQAQALRNLVRNRESLRQGDRRTKIVTITSGKGGVGKSNFTLNFALSLQSLGQKALVFDADIGMANIDVLMGVQARYHLYHLLKREKTIWEIIHTGPKELQFIAGGSGFQDLLALPEEDLNYFTEQVDELTGSVDYILFDTGAGLSKETLKFIVAADETIVVTTPEPTSITDAYALIKVVHRMRPDVSFQLVVNRVTDVSEGRQTADKIKLVAEQFLDLDIPTLGYLSDDSNVSKAVKKQVPFTIAFPNSVASKEIAQMSTRFITGQRYTEPVPGGVKGFFNKMLRLQRK